MIKVFCLWGELWAKTGIFRCNSLSKSHILLCSVTNSLTQIFAEFITIRQISTISQAYGVLKIYFKHILGIPHVCVKRISCLSQCYVNVISHILGISQVYLKHISVIFQIHLAQILGISKTNLYHLSGISQVPLMHMSGIYNNNSGISQAYLNDISSFSHSYLKHFSSISWVPKTSRTLRIRACP